MRKRIPINLVMERASKLSEATDYSKIPIPYITLRNNLLNANYDYSTNIKKYIKECRNDSDYISKCVDLLNFSESNDIGLFNDICNSFINNVLPYCKDTTLAAETVQNINNKSFRERVLNELKIYEACDRLAGNNSSLSKRYNINELTRQCRCLNEEEICESLCDMLDTYNTSIVKKICISIEEAMYVYEKSGINANYNSIVSNVLEYFLRKNPIISDKESNGIVKLLETDIFLEESDLSQVQYFFNERESFSSKVKNLSNNMINGYRELLRDISECTSFVAAKVIIKRAFDLIFSTFIISASVAFTMVCTVIYALYALILIVGLESLLVIEEIKYNKNRIQKAKLTDEQKERAQKVSDTVDKISVLHSSELVKEVADLLDQADIEQDPDDEVIHEPDDIESLLKESEEYADSNDVKDLINKYKADQNKTESKLKSVIRKIYTKSPEQIIDNTPHILDFIRNFGILATITIPNIGVVLGIVTFCADRFIAMGLKRKETEKVLKYFNNEKNKVERRLDNMKSNGKRREELEKYLGCLDKCISQIETYRDNLYSEKELDKIKGYEESYSSYAKEVAMTLDEFLSDDNLAILKSAFNTVKENLIDRISKNEELRISSEYTYDIDKDDKEQFVLKYVNQDGIVNIPILSVNIIGNNNESSKSYIFDCCSYANDFVDKQSYIVSVCMYGELACFMINVFPPIYTGNLNEMDCSLTQDAREVLSLFKISEMTMDITEECDYANMDKYICRNVDYYIDDDLQYLALLYKNANIDCTNLIESLNDCLSMPIDYVTENKINEAIDILKSNNRININEESNLLQVEAALQLQSIIEFTKNDKSRTNKKKAVKTIKNNVEKAAKDSSKKISSAVGNIANKTKDGKIAFTTNLGLAIEAMKKKIQNLGTKEKEISQSIDASASTLKHSIEKAITNDRREAIIKGSIIPSFSKMIKTAIVAGAGFAIAPVVTAIGCVGALAASKSLNDKERVLLIDEIDIELKVVEKELENADRDGNTNKYRELLTYQRKLQRESQRLKYRVKVYSKEKVIDPKV